MLASLFFVILVNLIAFSLLNKKAVLNAAILESLFNVKDIYPLYEVPHN